MESRVIIGVAIMLILSLGTYLVVGTRYWPSTEQRASELLRSVLLPGQYSQLIQQGYIDIPSPSDPDRVYRVPRFPGRVQVREKGRATMWLCLQPREWLPDADIVVIHKLLIEANEEIYLQPANRSAPL